MGSTTLLLTTLVVTIVCLTADAYSRHSIVGGGQDFVRIVDGIDPKETTVYNKTVNSGQRMQSLAEYSEQSTSEVLQSDHPHLLSYRSHHYSGRSFFVSNSVEF